MKIILCSIACLLLVGKVLGALNVHSFKCLHDERVKRPLEMKEELLYFDDMPESQLNTTQPVNATVTLTTTTTQNTTLNTTDLLNVTEANDGEVVIKTTTTSILDGEGLLANVTTPVVNNTIPQALPNISFLSINWGWSINQTLEQGPIRLTWDVSELQPLITEDTLNYLLRMLNIIQTYFYDSLWVDRVRVLRWPQKEGGECYSAKIKEPVAIRNSDLHIYVRGVYDVVNLEYLAFGAACVVAPRPVFGYLEINIAELFFLDLTDPLVFQTILDQLIHQHFHILGFSKELYPFWLRSSDGENKERVRLGQITKRQRWGARQLQTLLTTPKIKEWVRKYYNCTEIDGMLLENGAQMRGDLSSHWEQAIFYQDLMTITQPFGSSFISELDMALLHDTNWYRQVNMRNIDYFSWGKNRGCGFLRQLCMDGEGLSNYPEFNYTVGCSFDGLGFGGPIQDPYMNGCLFNAPFQNLQCFDTLSGKKLFADNTTMYFGTDSRCFTGKIIPAPPVVNITLPPEPTPPVLTEPQNVTVNSTQTNVAINTTEVRVNNTVVDTDTTFNVTNTTSDVTTTPITNVTNVTTPLENVTTPLVNVTPPLENVTTPIVNVTNTTTPLNVTIPIVNVTTPMNESAPLLSVFFRDHINNWNAQCHQMECLPDGTIRIVINKSNASDFVICQTPGQMVQAPPGYTGSILCPLNFEDFCFTGRQCPDACSRNGYCTAGLCYCTQGFTGINCGTRVENQNIDNITFAGAGSDGLPDGPLNNTGGSLKVIGTSGKYGPMGFNYTYDYFSIFGEKFFDDKEMEGEGQLESEG